MRSTGTPKRILFLFISLMMFSTLQNSPVVADGIPDEQYVLPWPPSSTVAGVQFMDTLFANLPGYLAAVVPDAADAQNNSTNAEAMCTSIDDAVCKAGAMISYMAHFPTCRDGEDIDCVVGIYAIKPDGMRVDGIFLRGLPEAPSNPWEGNPALGIPRSGVDGLWRLPGILNGSGSDVYLVIAQQTGVAIKQKDTSLTQRIFPDFFGAGIIPVKVILGSYVPAHAELKPNSNGTKRLIFANPGGPGAEVCAVVSTTECARREAFPPDIIFGLSLRLSGEIKGWLHGRIRDPLIDYKSSSTDTRITIQALPVSVPVVAGWTEMSNLPAVVPGTGIVHRPVSSINGTSSGDSMFSLLKVWLPLVGEKAQANPTSWQFGNLSYSELPGANACLFDSKSLAGFVSTNSTVYTAGPPLYNSVTGSIDYKLASPHFTSKGEVFKGVYNLTIRSDVARCIYKFTDAPIKATISVTDDSGQSSVAVESMSEHDGWIYLSASGFTFSSPTVHVKLIGTPIPVAPIATPTPTPIVTPTLTPTVSPTPIPTPDPTPVTAVPKKANTKKVTISCIKGKTIKKVTALKPTCPKGYRKK